MSLRKSTFKETLGELFQRNGTVLTLFGAAVIVVGGITIIEDPSRWWVSLLAVASFFLVVFLFLNAKVVVKAILTFVVTSLLASAAFTTGAFASPYDSTGSLWLLATFFTLFLCLFLSYQLRSGQSRWGSTFLATVVGFLVTYVLLLSNLGSYISIGAGILLAVGAFILVYKFGRRTHYSKSHFPETTVDHEFIKQLEREVLPHGWGMKPVLRRKKPVSILLWNDKNAFVVTRLHLQQGFGAGGKKASYLSYAGKSLNPWLIDLAGKLVPEWGVGGAEPLLVLLDVNNRNGNTTKVVGASLVDSQKKLAVAVVPAQGFLKKDRLLALLEKIEADLDDFLLPLSPRQVRKLDSKLPRNEEDSSSVGSSTSKTDSETSQENG